MKSKKLNTKENSNSSGVNEETNDLDKLVKKTTQQDKLLKKMIEEIKKSTKEK